MATTHGPASRGAALLSSSELCLSCGKCCDGSVFTSTTLDTFERQHFKLNELPQPCAYFKGACVIYEDRPKACEHFACNAARELLERTMTLEQALQSTRRGIVL
jgi:Fe-S-cluster containining protein